MIKDDGPVDGYSVEPTENGQVAIVFSNRYGDADRFIFEPEDARRIGEALVEVADSGSGIPADPEG